MQVYSGHWRQHPHNHDHYTFGQGGFWSPQQYHSVGVPLRLQASQPRWSTELSVQWSYSSIRNTDIVYFPAHSQLQQAYPDSIFPGQTSRGQDLSVALQAAYRLARSWTLGLQASKVHAIDYQPRQVQLFIRYESMASNSAPAPAQRSYVQY